MGSRVGEMLAHTKNAQRMVRDGHASFDSLCVVFSVCSWENMYIAGLRAARRSLEASTLGWPWQGLGRRGEKRV